MYYNKYFPGHLIGMPPILQDDSVTYATTLRPHWPSRARCLGLLDWAAEPHLEARKQTGVKVSVPPRLYGYDVCREAQGLG
jgi:cytochrome c1